jgi:hypothetical protein
MRKSNIFLLVSIIFVFFFSSSFDFPRFRKERPNHQRMHRYQIHSLNNGQPFKAGDREYAPDRVIVKFKPTLSIQSRQKRSSGSLHSIFICSVSPNILLSKRRSMH